MYKLKVNQAGDGIQFVLDESEFDAWILQFDDVLSRIKVLKDSNAQKDIKTLKNIRAKLMAKTQVDMKNREAYCFLPIYEFEVAMHFLTFDLAGVEIGQENNSPFKQLIKNPLVKRR